MPILTDAQKQALKARLQQADVSGLGDAEAAAALSAQPVVPNAQPAPKVSRPFNAVDVLALLPDATAKAISALPWFATIVNHLEARNLDAIRHWFALLVRRGDLAAADAQKVRDYIVSQVDDPDWPAQVIGPSWAQQSFGGAAFPHPNPAYRDAAGNPTTRLVSGQVTPEMVAEARAG